MKADRDLFKCVFSASASGREIDIPHQLTTVPISLVSSDVKLRATDKAPLSHKLAGAHEVKELPPTANKTCVIIDAMALVQAIGKP